MDVRKIKLLQRMQRLTITIRDAGEMTDSEADLVVKYLRNVARKFKKERKLLSKRCVYRFYI